MVFHIKIVDFSSFFLIIEEELKTKICTKKVITYSPLSVFRNQNVQSFNMLYN